MRIFGLIGYPLTHSFSKSYFSEKFVREGITDCQFENFALSSLEEFDTHVLGKFPDLKGLAITIPYKQQILRFLDTSDSIPAGLNACNCIKVDNGKLIGFNTDFIGFEKSFTPLLQPQHQKALILGNGGATEAVAFVLKKYQIDYRIVSRKIHSGSHWVYNQVDEQIFDEYKVIINTTPLGMYPDVTSFPPLPYEALTNQHYLYDLIYNPDKTIFLKKGEEQGTLIKNGSDMLVIQAEENWKIWNA